MPFDSTNSQGEFLINQWLRELRPRNRDEIMKRRESGFQQRKVRDPLPLFFPLAFPENRTSPMMLPSRGEVMPIIDEGSSDISGGAGGTWGHGTFTYATGSTPTPTPTGTASGTPTTIATPTPTPTPTTTPVYSGGSGTPITVGSPDTGGAGDLGCGTCNFAPIGDARLPCLYNHDYCLPYNGSGVLCGVGGQFCPSAYTCEHDCLRCNACVDPSGCPAFAVICCYSDNSILGNFGPCCLCATA